MTPDDIDMQERFEAELARVTGQPVRISGQHGDLAWVYWQPNNQVVLYDLRRAIEVLADFSDGEASSPEGATQLAIALENEGAYHHNLDQFQWWRAIRDGHAFWITLPEGDAPEQTSNDAPVDDHILFVDDATGVLHLTMQPRRGGSFSPKDAERCARTLDAWLERVNDRPVTELLVCTVFEHHADLDPVIDVLATRRPHIDRLLLGASTFPDFGRGSYTPADPDKDGSSWRLDFRSIARLIAALPHLDSLVIHTSQLDELERGPISAPALRRLTLRTSPSPATVAALARITAPQLETLELWMPSFAYDWGGEAETLAPLLHNHVGLPKLRHLALVSDLGDALVDVLVESPILQQLAVLDLSHGTVGDAGAARLLDSWPRLAHLRSLVVTGNTIGPSLTRALLERSDAVRSGWQRRADPGDEIGYSHPPMISLRNGLLDGWSEGTWQRD